MSDPPLRTHSFAHRGNGWQLVHKISHLGFGAFVVYGNGIFMTISSGERHNYLAILFSRYRDDDPYVGNLHSPWIGSDMPLLQPGHNDFFGVDIPGYDLRKIWLAGDPLAVANAFFVQIRTVLATVSLSLLLI